MVASAATHADALAAEGDALAELTAARVEAGLGGALVAAAVAAIQRATPNSGKGLAEFGADVAQVTSDTATAITDAGAALAAFVQQSMEEAIVAGFGTEVRAQDRLTPDALAITLDPQGLATVLATVPVQGHTCESTGRYQAQAYAFGAEGVLGTATALGSALAVPPGMAEQARLAGARAGAAVAEAFHTGAGIARQAVGAALQRAVAGG